MFEGNSTGPQMPHPRNLYMILTPSLPRRVCIDAYQIIRGQNDVPPTPFLPKKKCLEGMLSSKGNQLPEKKLIPGRAEALRGQQARIKIRQHTVGERFS